MKLFGMPLLGLIIGASAAFVILFERVQRGRVRGFDIMSRSRCRCPMRNSKRILLPGKLD